MHFDDFHYFHGKEKSQELIMKLVDYLIMKNNQVIVAVCLLSEGKTGFFQGLISRIKSGLTVYIDKPVYET